MSSMQTDEVTDRESALRKLEATFECLTCVPIVGIVQRSDEKFWERCVFENFMCSLRALHGELDDDEDDKKHDSDKKDEPEKKDDVKKPEAKEVEEEEEEGMDDLAMFVRKGEPTYFVRRRSATQDVLLTRAEKETVDWQESFLLNMVMQQLYFELTVYVCRINKDGKYVTVNQTSTRVYPSTVKVNVKSVMKRSTKQDKEDSYPVMYFTMYDFDDVFRNMLLSPSLTLCVELNVDTTRSSFLGVPMGPAFAPAQHTSIFRGAIDYNKIDMAYAKQDSGFFSKLGRAFHKKEDLSVGPGGAGARDSRFVTVNGPHNVGKVQFCFNKHIVSSSQPSTPALDDDSVGGVTPSLTPPPKASTPQPAVDKKRRSLDVQFTEYQCMPYFLSLDIHEIVRAIVKKLNN